MNQNEEEDDPNVPFPDIFPHIRNGDLYNEDDRFKKVQFDEIVRHGEYILVRKDIYGSITYYLVQVLRKEGDNVTYRTFLYQDKGDGWEQPDDGEWIDDTITKAQILKDEDGVMSYKFYETRPKQEGGKRRKRHTKKTKKRKTKRRHTRRRR